MRAGLAGVRVSLPLSCCAAFKQSFIMLRPDIQWKNPVMFVVEVGTVLTLIFTFAALAGKAGQAPVTYLIALDVWLFLTVLFANFASALAEARGKAQADALRKTRQETPAYRLRSNGQIEETVSTAAESGRSGCCRSGSNHSGRRRNRRRGCRGR